MTTETMPFTAAVQRTESDSPIRALREAALQRYHDLGFPTQRIEAWKFTNLRELKDISFDRAAVSTAVTADDIARCLLPADAAHRVVFVNGRFDERLSTAGTEIHGVTVLPLAVAMRDHFDLIEPSLGTLDRYADDPFAALNTAAFEDGAFIHVPANTNGTLPIHLVFVTTAGDAPVMTTPRVLVVAGASSKATVVESYVTAGDGTTFTNAVTEIVAGANATIEHYRDQRESESTFHISNLFTSLDRDCNVTSSAATIGGKLTRNSIDAVLNGENIDVTFNGLYLTHDQQHVDNHLRIDHMQPHCRSWQFYKGILDDRSTSAFAGRIYVAEDAQKTDAKQTNQNLLLSDDARVDTKPQLEIFADDVKCTHGATIGQLEPSQLFYLRARGIHADAAHSLLTYAFANEVIDEITLEPLRVQLESELMSRLPGGAVLLGGR